MNDKKGEGAGLYLHVPFCSFVCPYCDFAVARHRPGAELPWLEAVIREAELRSAWPFEIDTIYLGGGTPSLLSAAQLEGLLAGLKARLPIRPDARLFMEANPEDVDREALARWLDLGLDFLSLGIQSFDAAELRFLGRRHDPDLARRALEEALAAAPEVVSVDLIFGLPDQELETWLASIKAATPPGVDHVSCYQLTIKPGTLFAKRQALGRLEEIPDGLQGDFFLATHEALLGRGLEAYEVSNFARRPATQSAHNRKYWHQVPYLGLGPSAHSFDGRSRYWNRASEADWRQALESGDLPTEASEVLTDRELLVEALMLGIRTTEGLDLRALERRFGYRPDVRQERKIEEFTKDGLIRREGSILRPTTRGLAVADSLAADLCPEEMSGS